MATIQAFREDIEYKLNVLGWRLFRLSPAEERELIAAPCTRCGGYVSYIIPIRDPLGRRCEVTEWCLQCGYPDKV